MRRISWALAIVMTLCAAVAARAQDTWVQIEALPTLTEAQERAQAYSGAFPDVQGYRLASGWYAIVLGPYAPDEALNKLSVLRAERMIPSDSFIAEPGTLTRAFWPAGLNAPATTEAPTTEAPTEPLTTSLPELPDETRNEALASEELMASEGRMDLQRAMQWFGVYKGAIDGSFGKGTRTAMAEWQGLNGYEPTGVLTSRQRAALTEAWAADRAALGLQTVTEHEAGIAIDLPLGLVEFKGYQPPFVAYDAKAGSGWQAFLISERGDQKSLVALFDRVQALSVIPLGGERVLKKTGFEITAEGEDRAVFAKAALEGGFIKGYILVAPLADTERRARVLDAMAATFTPTGSTALDENLGEPSTTSASDLTEGLAIRRPAISRTGVYVDGAGTVLTSTEALQSCAKITLDGRTEATVAYENADLGFAILKPAAPLAPRAFAEIAPALPRLDSDVAIAGYSYEDKLSAPVISSGTFSEAQGLNGEKDLARLTLVTLPGDVGGAVLDSSGAMIGMLAPRKDEAGRDLPKDVSFIIQSAAIEAALAADPTLKDSPIALIPSAQTGALAIEDLAKRARDMTVLVSCWN